MNIELLTLSRIVISDKEDEGNDAPPEQLSVDFATKALPVEEQAAKRAKVEPMKSLYVPLMHLSPTSNIVERLFSIAKHVLSDRRKGMTPYHLELLLFLRCDKSLWSEMTLQEILDRPTVTTNNVAEEASPHQEESQQCSDEGV